MGTEVYEPSQRVYSGEAKTGNIIFGNEVRWKQRGKKTSRVTGKSILQKENIDDFLWICQLNIPNLDWIWELIQLHKHRLFVKLIDVQSPLGIYESLRHWIRKYPTFIVEGPGDLHGLG